MTSTDRVATELQGLPPEQGNAEWIGLLGDVVDHLSGTVPSRSPDHVG